MIVHSGYFDPCPGGVVGSGESYEVTNEREVAEEMGITNTPMEHLFTFYYEDERFLFISLTHSFTHSLTHSLTHLKNKVLW